MSEVPSNSTTVGYLMTTLRQNTNDRLFPLCNSPARLPKDKGSKNLASVENGDTTHNWCQINKLIPYSVKLVTTDKLSAAIQVPDTLNLDPLDRHGCCSSGLAPRYRNELVE